jgi:hypothetical protein
MPFLRSLPVAACLCVAVVAVRAEEPRSFRTDAQGPFTADELKKLKSRKAEERDSVLQWYQLEAGRFPPAGSAHAVSGELIYTDHLERRFQLRVDRNDSQDRGQWDLAVDAGMLPYGAISFHGSPAALQDVPLGTHMHGQFYLRTPDDNAPPAAGRSDRRSPEWEFRRCFMLEDDVSYYTRRNEVWKVESVDLAAKRMVGVLQREGTAIGKPQNFDLLTSTVVYTGEGFADLKAIQPGQKVLFNLTWGTLYGPGRIVEIYLDETSRKLAAARQLERHRNHVRERGLAGWIDAVDDEAETVTLTFFGGVDPKLFDELTLLPPPPPVVPGAPPMPVAKPAGPRGGLAVALESLMTYDPVNDRKGATILEVKQVPVEPGSSGVQIRVKCDMMLEGFRPKRIVRFYPPTWKVAALPREEQYQGRE